MLEVFFPLLRKRFNVASSINIIRNMFDKIFSYKISISTFHLIKLHYLFVIDERIFNIKQLCLAGI